MALEQTISIEPDKYNFSEYIRYTDMKPRKEQKIEIRHQVTQQIFKFEVGDKKKLTPLEVNHICTVMGCHAVLIEGRYYRNNA